MSSLRRWERDYNPWRDLLNLETFNPSDFMRQSKSFPAVNISEDDQGFVVEVIAPGFQKENFTVNVEDDILTISAETKTETASPNNSRQYNRQEYSYNSFSRSFQLPDNAKDDSITASYSDGILKLQIPKSKHQVKATKQITVN